MTRRTFGQTQLEEFLGQLCVVHAVLACGIVLTAKSAQVRHSSSSSSHARTCAGQYEVQRRHRRLDVQLCHAAPDQLGTLASGQAQPLHQVAQHLAHQHTNSDGRLRV